MLPKIQPALSDYYSDNAEPLKTRLFNTIWQNYQTKQTSTNNNAYSPKILDTGTAQPESFNFYSEHCCYLTIADCIHELIQLDWPEEDNPNSVILKKIQDIFPATRIKYDLILGWDSFNYINPKILPHLHNHLLDFCHKDTIIHGFLLTSENYPSKPGSFKIISADKIQHSVSTRQEKQHTPLTPIAINRYFPGFKYARSVLMRSGLQEFILTRK